MNQVDFSQAGNAQQPSGAIWGNCPGPVLNDIGSGYYVHEDMLGGTVNFATGVGVGGQNPFTIDADTGTTIAHSATVQGGILNLAISGTDNNAAALYQNPFGPLTLNSGFESWFEARAAINALGDGNFGLFFGWVAGTVATRDVIADNPDAVTSMVGDSLFGINCMSNNVGLLNAVIAKDGGGVQTIATDLGHSSALTSAQQFTLADGVFHKFGTRFDGKHTLYIYVDGIQVSRYTLTTSVANSADNLSPIVAVKTGAATARQLNIDWIRAAYRTRR